GLSFAFYAKRDSIHTITSEIEDITTGVLKLVKQERDFFEVELKDDKFFGSGQSQYYKQGKITLQTLQRKIKNLSLKPEIEEFGVQGKLDMLSEELSNYDKTMKRVVELHFAIGNYQYGLERKMRDAIHQLEYKNAISPIVMLSLRRHEKDYLMRRDSLSIIKFDSLIRLAKAEVQPQNKVFVENYESSFKQIIRMEVHLGVGKKEVGYYHKLKESSSNSISLIESVSRIVEKRVAELRGEFQNIFVIILLIVVVLSITFSYFISFFMTIPVTELSRSMQKAVEMNFSEDLKPARKYTNDEIGILTDDFNLMISRIQQQLREIKNNSMLLKLSNEEMQETNQKLAESEKRLSKFLLTKETLFNIITQDLKSPLNSLKGFLSLMQHHPDTFSPEELKGVASDMYVSFDKITVLMTSLVQWSQTQTGDMAYNPNRFNISPMIEQVIAHFSLMAQSKKIKITNSVESKELWVDADKDMINFTLRNLLSNAIKFTNENGMIEVSTKKFNNMLMFSIKDNGVGMSQELLEKVFQPEVHISMLGTNNERGSGFGLMMCKDFIEKNRGKLYIESELNKGTTVHFTLSTPENS
ncbi:MAG: ATP-binding protein, partial [Thermonemataceae bacterium]|nr:ATP-binding protein [Thermonemataceae bacterium]